MNETTSVLSFLIGDETNLVWNDYNVHVLPCKKKMTEFKK